MNDKTTISLLQLFEMFPNQAAARNYLESRLCPIGVCCPVCATQDRITTRKNGYYRCNMCKVDFTVRTGTIFERSHVPLHKWLYAMYLLVTSRKGISSLQLSKEIVITQKSAWFVLQRLREACGNDIDKLYQGNYRTTNHIQGFNRMTKIIKALDTIADIVLHYRPKPKSAPAKKRERKRKKIIKEPSI